MGVVVLKISEVERNFIDIIDPNKRNPQHRCTHCGYTSIKAAGRGLVHLKQCKEYIDSQQFKPESIEPVVKLTQLSIVSNVRALNQCRSNSRDGRLHGQSTIQSL